MSEPRPEPIGLPLSVASFTRILQDAARNNGLYSHHQIAEWAYRLWREVSEGALEDAASPELRRAAEIGLDIDAQWDLFLANTYSVTELQSMDFSTVRLPVDWFQDWLRRLEEREV